MRSGTYALYRNEEYEVSRLNSRSYKLRSYHVESQKEGFQHHPSGCYLKIVSFEDISAAYEVRHHAIYKGLEFPVFREEGSKLLLGSGIHGPDIIKKYAFVEVDRYEYEKWVDRSEVERYFEVKVPMWGLSAQDDK